MARHSRHPGWQQAYVKAMLEMTPASVPARVAIAEHAIHTRMVSGKASPEERQAILTALNALKFLNR
jgi:hypothetical protein